MKRLALLLTLAPFAAHAQMYQVTIPPPFIGQGTMSVTTSSQAVSSANVTKAPNSGAFPTSVLPLGVLRIKQQAGTSGNLAVCWQGGTCTTSVGELLTADESRIVTLPVFSANPPTLIASTGTITVEVEW